MAVRAPSFEWTEARIAVARRAYVEEHRGASGTALVVGDGCTMRNVSKLAYRLRWAALLPAGMLEAQRSAGWLKASASGVAARQAAAAARQVPPRPAPSPTSDLVALAAEAVRSGRVPVRVMPPGVAAGLTAAEENFWAARPSGQGFNGGWA